MGLRGGYAAWPARSRRGLDRVGGQGGPASAPLEPPLPFASRQMSMVVLLLLGSLRISLSTCTWLSTLKARVPLAIEPSTACSTLLFTTPVRVTLPFATTIRIGGFTKVA